MMQSQINSYQELSQIIRQAYGCLNGARTKCGQNSFGRNIESDHTIMDYSLPTVCLQTDRAHCKQ